MSPCEIDSSKNYSRKKRHHQANAGNDDSRMSLLSFRWWRQTRLNSVSVTLATLATRKLWSLWEAVLGIISCLVWLHRGSKLTRSRISTPHRRSWRALLWIAGLKVLSIDSWHC